MIDISFASPFLTLISKALVDSRNNSAVHIEIFLSTLKLAALNLYFPILQVFSTIDSTCVIKRAGKLYTPLLEYAAIDLHVYR